MPRSRSRAFAGSSTARGRGITASASRRRAALASSSISALDWGANAAAVGIAVQQRVAEYLGRMTDLDTASVDVVVDDFGPPPEGG